MKIYRKISYILFCLFGILLVLVFSGSNGTPEQDFNSLVVACFVFVLGCGFMLYYRYGQKPWNEMTFEKQCDFFARQLVSGKRSWFLNPVENDFFAFPLSPRNMNEFGGGVHISSNLERVKQLMDSGQIKNTALVTGILQILSETTIENLPDHTFYSRKDGSTYIKINSSLCQEKKILDEGRTAMSIGDPKTFDPKEVVTKFFP